MKYIVWANVKVSTLEKRGFEIEAYSESAAAKAVENHIRNTYPHELGYNKKAIEFENIIEVEAKK